MKITKLFPWLCLSLALLTGGCAFGQFLPEAKWSATVRVVDENGAPMAGVNMAFGCDFVATTSDPIKEASGRFHGITGTNGVFAASHTDESMGLRIDAKKAGYYSSCVIEKLFIPGEYDDATVAKSRKLDLTLVLRKIVNPIPMYAKSLRHSGVPESGKAIGFDLMVGDWVGPYGKGINTDILFEDESHDYGGGRFFSKTTVRFPKPGDGLQLMELSEAEKGSNLRSGREAPAEGYLPELTRESGARPGEARKDEYDPDRVYFIRVQTVLDHDGKVVSAHYGKIYGDFMGFVYYLNPTPNDRNVEFDPKQNLILHLGWQNEVSAP